MNVAYCPFDKKAGLRFNDGGCFGGEVMLSYFRDPPAKYGLRWCPRCKKWVHPEYKKVILK